MKGNHTYALEPVPTDGVIADALLPDTDQNLRVTVVSTTPDGTVAALIAAADLARHLSGRIVLLAPEVIPFLLPLDHPHVAIDFLKKRYCDLVARAGLEDEPVTIRILLCRDCPAALKQTLAAHSLIVIGGSARWWHRRERKLALRLERLGHRVVFVNSEAPAGEPREAEMGRQVAFYRVLDKEARGMHQ
jgi:hypothetical protein